MSKDVRKPSGDEATVSTGVARQRGAPLSPALWPTSGRRLKRNGRSLRAQPRPQALPFKGNRFTRWIGWTMLRLHGWDLAGQWPDAKKVIAVAAPHTSNFDAYLAIWVQLAINVQFSFFIKKEVFFWPMSLFWLWLGGVPVDRKNPAGLLEAVSAQARAREQFVFVVTPEGTRHPPKRLKSGVWRLSKELDIPLTPITWDYDTKTLWFDSVLAPVDTFEQWEQQLYRYWDGIRGGGGYWMGVEPPDGQRYVAPGEGRCD